jgi:hypothetical protein
VAIDLHLAVQPEERLAALKQRAQRPVPLLLHLHCGVDLQQPARTTHTHGPVSAALAIARCAHLLFMAGSRMKGYCHRAQA